MSEHVSIEKLFNDKMWIVTLHQGNRETVDAWEQTVRQYIAAVNNAPERYLVYDTTPIQNLGFTRYLQQRAIVLASDNREATGRVGIALAVPSMIASFFDIFVGTIGTRLQPELSVKIFSQREEAANWVSEIVPSEAETNR